MITRVFGQTLVHPFSFPDIFIAWISNLSNLDLEWNTIDKKSAFRARELDKSLKKRAPASSVLLGTAVFMVLFLKNRVKKMIVISSPVVCMKKDLKHLS